MTRRSLCVVQACDRWIDPVQAGTRRVLRALGQDFVISCRRWLTIEPRLLPPIVPWLAGASVQIFVVILVDNMGALLGGCAFAM